MCTSAPLRSGASSLSFIATGRHDDAQAWLDRHAQPPGREGFAMYDQVHLLAPGPARGDAWRARGALVPSPGRVAGTSCRATC